MGLDDPVGEGTTTLDWLCYKYPWLKELLDEKDQALKAEQEAHQKTAKQLVDMMAYVGHIEKKLNILE